MKKLLCLTPLGVCGPLLLATVVLPASAEFKCDGRPLPRVDAAACVHAAQGPDALRRYVARTQSMYSLQMRDYVRFIGDEPKARAPSVQAAGSGRE